VLLCGGGGGCSSVADIERRGSVIVWNASSQDARQVSKVARIHSHASRIWAVQRFTHAPSLSQESGSQFIVSASADNVLRFWRWGVSETELLQREPLLAINVAKYLGSHDDGGGAAAVSHMKWHAIKDRRQPQEECGVVDGEDHDDHEAALEASRSALRSMAISRYVKRASQQEPRCGCSTMLNEAHSHRDGTKIACGTSDGKVMVLLLEKPLAAYSATSQPAAAVPRVLLAPTAHQGEVVTLDFDARTQSILASGGRYVPVCPLARLSVTALDAELLVMAFSTPATDMCECTRCRTRR